MEQCPYDKPLVAQLVKNSVSFTEHEGSLRCWEEPATGPHPEPHESAIYNRKYKI
jgi:hypothetical protein